MYGLIYKATNILSNKCYIGQTTKDFKNYSLKHVNDALKFRNKSDRYFYRAIRKYGTKNFKWEILGYCNSREELNEAEIACIGFFQSNNSIYGYNMTIGGEGSKGRIVSELTKKRLSESHKGQKAWNKGITNFITYTPDILEKISKAHKGKKQSKEHIRKRTESRKGYKHTEESKKKLRLPKTEEWKKKISESRKGFIMTEETKEKIRVTMRKEQKKRKLKKLLLSIDYLQKNLFENKINKQLVLLNNIRG